jgi:acyl transferase domain-containing protein
MSIAKAVHASNTLLLLHHLLRVAILLSLHLLLHLVPALAATGGALSVASGRLAYTYGMRSAALSVDTACSSSLVASHFVVSQLAAGVSAAGIAAGVGVLLSPSPTAMFQKAGMLAPDGRCKTLDASADGYVRSESAGVLILQSFAAGSVSSSSQVFLALMAGSAVNQDGRSSSLTAPNGPAQQEVLRAALTDAGLVPGSITGLQMHGTGTPLGELLSPASLLSYSLMSPQMRLLVVSLHLTSDINTPGLSSNGCIQTTVALRAAATLKHCPSYMTCVPVNACCR